MNIYIVIKMSTQPERYDAREHLGDHHVVYDSFVFCFNQIQDHDHVVDKINKLGCVTFYIFQHEKCGTLGYVELERNMCEDAIRRTFAIDTLYVDNRISQVRAIAWCTNLLSRLGNFIWTYGIPNKNMGDYMLLYPFPIKDNTIKNKHDVYTF